MPASMLDPVICIVGPTASGKSELAQCVAEAVGGEVVGADSMQVYRGMDIGTGKVPVEERRVPHHCLDLVDPGEPFSAALFQAHARSAFAEIGGRRARAVLCGGTGFYVRAAVDDYRFPAGGQVGNETRDRLNGFAAEYGAQALWERLKDVDADSARIIPPADVKRVVRAFELLEDGTSYAVQKEALAGIQPWCPAAFFGLQVTPSILAGRIEERVDAMFASGLVDEVQGLLDRGFRDGVTAPAAIGYKEVVAALDGRCRMEEAAQEIKAATRRYAKRQRTWFRKDARIIWLNADDYDARGLACQVVERLS